MENVEEALKKLDPTKPKPAKPAVAWDKLYNQYIENGMTPAKAKEETEKVLGPKPKNPFKKSEGDELLCSSIELIKHDESLGLVFGYAIVCKIEGEDYYDLQGDHIPEDVMLKAAKEFMSADRLALDMHSFKVTKDFDPDSNCGRVVFAWPMTGEVAKAFDLEPSMTGLMIAMEPTAEVLAKFKSGERTGFSIGGFGRREPVTT